MKLCWQKMLFWHRICTTGTKTSSGPSSDATWSFSHSDVTAVVNRQTASRILTYNSLPVRLQLLDNEIQEHTWRRMTVQCDDMKSRNCTQRPGRRFCVGYEEACTQNTTTDLSTPGGRSVSLFLSPSLPLSLSATIDFMPSSFVWEMCSDYDKKGISVIPHPVDLTNGTSGPLSVIDNA